MFDILVSWNSSYYMYLTPNLNFKLHERIWRILKKNGFIIMSLPKRSSYIFKNSKYFKNGYRIIKNDYFKLRNGEVMRVFKKKRYN